MAKSAGAKAINAAGLRRIAPLRFVLFVVVTIVACAVAIPVAGLAHGTLIGFDIGAIAFLSALLPLFKTCETDDMRRHAAENDANRVLLLVLTALVMLVILVAIALELGGKGEPTPPAIMLVVATLFLSWLFTNTVYAVHYAHIYYLEGEGEEGGDNGGIDFPKTPEPDYWDFIYFSYTLGMTFQTSDSDICSRHLRRVATFHSFLAFVFNIGVVAFTINVLGSAHGG